MAAGSGYGSYPESGQRAPPPPPPDQAGGWQEAPPPAPAPAPAPQYQAGAPPPYYRPRGDIIPVRAAAIIVLVGVIIFFVGSILVQSTILIEIENQDDYDKVRNLTGSGRILNWVGAMIISMPLYVVGISNEKMDWKVRASMLTTATAIVIATMVVSLISQAPTYAL